MAKILLVVNEDRFFLSHRKDVALAARQQGYEFTVVCKDTGQRQDVEALGIPMIELPINPTGTNIKEELKTLFFLLKLYRKEKPDIVHHVGIKTILWGALAAKWTSVSCVVNAICGLGILFSGEMLSPMAKRILKVMKYANRNMNVSELFQNKDDKELFLSEGITTEEHCDFIKGSGVDLDEYAFSPAPDDNIIRVLFSARMVAEKGTLTLIEAAELLRKEYQGKAEFLLCGDISNNPNGIKKEELEQMCDGEYIKWLGFRSDIPDLLKSSHIFAFPSYYREGVPRSLIEACAVGRPIVTCDSIGCRDTVDDGVNGFLIQPRNARQLAEKLRILFENPALRGEMGKKGREKAEKEFDITVVKQKHLDIYRKLLEQRTKL